MPVFRMLYVSGATRPMTPTDLDEILAVSRRNNAREDVTGVLLWAEGAFIQVLEGDERKVRELAKRISHDTRHRNFMVLVEQTVPERVFGEWAMGYKHLAPEQESEALFRTSHETLAARIAPSDGGLMLDMVLAFATDFIEGGGRARR